MADNVEEGAPAEPQAKPVLYCGGESIAVLPTAAHFVNKFTSVHIAAGGLSSVLHCSWGSRQTYLCQSTASSPPVQKNAENG